MCTIKFQNEADFTLIDQFLKIPNSKMVHLYHNKHEVMWWAQRVKTDLRWDAATIILIKNAYLSLKISKSLDFLAPNLYLTYNVSLEYIWYLISPDIAH